MRDYTAFTYGSNFKKIMIMLEMHAMFVLMILKMMLMEMGFVN